MSEPGLAETWAALKRSGRTALIPYLTAGHPDRAASLEALRRAAEHADIIEVGVAFSDPLADGPTIQRSTFEALQGGMTVASTLELIAEARLDLPVVVFSYLNPLLRYGIDRFVRDAAEIGVAGLLLTDLPAGTDQSTEAIVRQSPLALIRLVAPTSAGPRLTEVVRDAEGFLYLVARLGVTGASRTLASGMEEYIARVRAVSTLPLAVGFGISTPEQARTVAHLADGVVVGSALVDCLAREGPSGAGRFLASLRAALDSNGAGR
ncbi:MAG: tryptophan synthase subunit alpha [Gemmatimonadales bacterium]